MKKFGLSTLLLMLAALTAPAQQPPPPPAGPPAASQAPPAIAPENAELAKRIETYYRHLYALGSNFQVTVTSVRPAPVPGLLEVAITLSDGRNTRNETPFVSSDGRHLIRGEIRDMAKDPFAESRAAIKLNDYPSRGPADASVTIVEYSDFQCPYCRQMYTTLETKVLKNHPNVRFVYKDFPLVQIHPWAMPAAIAGQCAYVQTNDAFWKIYTSLFENQKDITKENLEQKLDGFAAAAGLDIPKFKACLAGDEVKNRIQEEFKESQSLGLNSTPTLFVNGRPLVGNVPEVVLENVIQFELEKQATTIPPKPKADPEKPKTDQ